MSFVFFVSFVDENCSSVNVSEEKCLCVSLSKIICSSVNVSEEKSLYVSLSKMMCSFVNVSEEKMSLCLFVENDVFFC